MVSNVNLPQPRGPDSPTRRAARSSKPTSLEQDAVRPLYAGPMPENILKPTEPHVRNHALILEAAMNCDYTPAFEALMQDPLVGGRITEAEGDALLREMIRNTLAYLPKPWQTYNPQRQKGMERWMVCARKNRRPRRAAFGRALTLAKSSAGRFLRRNAVPLHVSAAVAAGLLYSDANPMIQSLYLSFTSCDMAMPVWVWTGQSPQDVLFRPVTGDPQYSGIAMGHFQVRL